MPRCPFCGSRNTRRRYGYHRRRKWRCRRCNRPFRRRFGILPFVVLLIIVFVVFALVSQIDIMNSALETLNGWSSRAPSVVSTGSILEPTIESFATRESLEAPSVQLDPATRLLTQTPFPTRTPKLTPIVMSDVVEADKISQEIETMVHIFVNYERSENGLNELKWDPELGLIARKHSVDMAQKGYFSHDSLNGDGPTDRAVKAGYHCSGGYYIGLAENIYQGWLYSSVSYGFGGMQHDWLTPIQIATNAVAGWMDSPGHRGNILDASYARSGVGVAVSEEGEVLFTQNFC